MALYIKKLIFSNPFSWLELWRKRRRAGDKGARRRRLEQGGFSSPKLGFSSFTKKVGNLSS